MKNSKKLPWEPLLLGTEVSILLLLVQIGL